MSGRTAAFILAAFTLLSVALATGATVYYLLAFTIFLLLAFAAETALFTLFTLKVRVSAPRRRVLRGESTMLRVSLARRSILPVGSIELTLSAPEGGAAHSALNVELGALRTREYRCSMTCPHRGRYQLGVVNARISDIFGFFTLGKRIKSGMVTVEVLPRVSEVETLRLTATDDGSRARVTRQEDTSSPSGVRSWQDGDELKRVHWKLTMRKRELMVRTFDESARPDTLVLIDLSPVQAVRSQALSIEDAMCEAAVSSALAQLKSGYPVRMPLACAAPTVVAGQHGSDIERFQDMLMRADFDSDYTFEQVVALETRRMRRTGGLVLITSRLNAAVCDFAMRMLNTDMRVRFIWVSEAESTETLTLLKKLELAGIEAERLDPWASGQVSA